MFNTNLSVSVHHYKSFYTYCFFMDGFCNLSHKYLLQPKQDSRKADGSMKASEDELTCTICLDQVNRGELVRSLPCLHQVLAQQST